MQQRLFIVDVCRSHIVLDIVTLGRGTRFTVCLKFYKHVQSPEKMIEADLRRITV